jgi:hypothetical protein
MQPVQQQYSTPGATGGQQTAGMPVQPPFTDQHNGVYNTLRNQMMQYAAAGVPGMEDVVNALNKTHTKLMSSYQPGQPVPPRQVAQGQPTTPLQTPQGLQQVRGLMDQIRQRNTPTPSGATSY